MLTRLIASLPAILLGCLLAGCQTNTAPTPAPRDTAPVQQPAKPAPEPERKRERKKEKVEASVKRGQLHVPVSDTETQALTGVFYFDYDQAVVKRSGFRELEQHANYLADNRRVKLRLEGHCDERGTREYNQALGERRAHAVRQYLISQGVRRSQIDVVSYGEEKPAARGSNESAWARNRRVNLVYK